MKRSLFIGMVLLLVLASCHNPQREARRMVRRAEQLRDTLPDSTAILIDSVLRMPVYFNEKCRMNMALLQAEACRDVSRNVSGNNHEKMERGISRNVSENNHENMEGDVS